MAENNTSLDCNIDWNSDDDREIDNYGLPSSSTLTAAPSNGGSSGSGEGSSSSPGSNFELIQHFVGMGFPEKQVAQVIDELGDKNHNLVLETLLTYSALENSPKQPNDIQVSEEVQRDLSVQELQPVQSDHSSADYCANSFDEFSDVDSPARDVETPSSDEDDKLLFLAGMGYSVDEASIAIERCGPDSTLEELTDFICAAQMARASDIHFIELDEKKLNLGSLSKLKRRKNQDCDAWKKKKHRCEEEDELIRLPKPMIGYGVPTESNEIVHRTIPEAAKGPPYFYYENVALAPTGVWNTISRFLYDIEPEFVDSKFFCACARKRGYIHNLPIENRFPLVPLPPFTIHEAFPLTKKWWPAWDKRTKLNCLQTSIGSAKMTERIRKALEECGDDDPPLHVQKYVLDLCRKWNLVWVGKNKLAPLEPDEFETLLGFPKNHTRGGGISRTDRYKSLGNSFQVDTVAYHLSVLKDMYPEGINVLSLFSGIGGAEIALHRLGIPLKAVVEVEISEANRNIMRSWWEQTNQRGTLIDIADVQQVDADKLSELIDLIGGFDLVIGGSPCNNLAGSNRVSRDGLEGKESALFYDYFRILDLVKTIMGSRSVRY
uniref:DNA (cytosine-5-)-methyltransferase n=1 Tax=Kalanchoe fedtschenkoi TaxID=63787 RepID=A0A7N0UA19_KALFE